MGFTVKLNLKNNYKTVPEGERILTITKAECKPSGKPSALAITLQDSEGGFVNSRFNFDNDKALFAMSKLLETVLGLGDGDSFDTKEDTPKLVGKTIIGEIVHTQGSTANENGELPIFANLRKVISLVDNSTGVVNTSDESPRNSISNGLDDLGL